MTNPHTPIRCQVDKLHFGLGANVGAQNIHAYSVHGPYWYIMIISTERRYNACCLVGVMILWLWLKRFDLVVFVCDTVGLFPVCIP